MNLKDYDPGENLPDGLDIACGKNPGVYSVKKFGANESVTQDVTEDVWDGGGQYPYPASALMVRASQVTDQPELRGKILEIEGLDENWGQVTQEAVLNISNTTNPVALTIPLLRIFEVRVQAGVVNSSEIKVHNLAGDVVYAIVKAGNNVTMMTQYSVPRGKTAFITSYFADYVRDSVKDPKSIIFKMWTADRKYGWAFRVRHARGIPELGSGFQHQFNPFLKVDEMTDIKITAKPSFANAHVNAGLEMIIMDNE